MGWQGTQEARLSKLEHLFDQPTFRIAQLGWTGQIVVEQLRVGTTVITTLEDGLKVERNVVVPRLQRDSNLRQGLLQVDSVKLAARGVFTSDRN